MEFWAQLSNHALEAAVAAYLVALLCLAYELAATRTVAASAGARCAQDELARAEAVGDELECAVAVEVTAESPADTAKRGFAERLGRAGVLVTVVGAVANLIHVVARGFAAQRLPLANLYEYTTAMCLLTVVCWLVVLRRSRQRAIGVFVLLGVLILAFVAALTLYVPAGPVIPALDSYWKWIHVTSVSASASVLMVSGAAAAVYLLRYRADQRVAMGKRSVWSRLPVLGTLDKIAYRTAVVAFPVYTFSIIAGALWAEHAWGRYWGWDPKETGALISWVVYAAYLHARSTAGWRGRIAAWICVIGLVSMIANLYIINLVVSGKHSYAGM